MIVSVDTCPNTCRRSYKTSSKISCTPMAFYAASAGICSLLNPVLPSAGIYQAMPGLPQRGPLRRSPAVLGLLPAASHETFKLVRLPATLRLISAHLLTDWRLRWPTVPNVRIVRGSVDHRCGSYYCFLMFLPEVFRVGITSNGAEGLEEGRSLW